MGKRENFRVECQVINREGGVERDRHYLVPLMVDVSGETHPQILTEASVCLPILDEDSVSVSNSKGNWGLRREKPGRCPLDVGR